MVNKQNLIRLVIYPVVGILSFVVSKRFFPTSKDYNERIKPKSGLPDNIIIQDPLDTRGGWLDTRRFFERFLENDARYFLMGTLGMCCFALGDRYSQILQEILRDASPAIAGLPIPLARRLLEGFNLLNPRELLAALKDGLMSKDLTMEEKLSLIRKTLHALIIAANTGQIRQKLLLIALLIIISTLFAYGPLFTGSLLVFQDIFTKHGFKRGTVHYIYSIYKEYNAPITKELFDLIEEVGLISELAN
jgi:hypothetical protein